MTSPLTSTSVATKGAEALAGIEAEAAQEEGEHRAGERAEGDDADERALTVSGDEQPVRAVVVPAELLPEDDADEADAAEDGAEGEAGGELAERDAPPVLERELAQRERADDERGGLRAGIAAGADDERDEEREHHRLADLPLEEAHRGGGEHLAEEERGEPAGALPDHREEADVACTAHRGPPRRRAAGGPSSARG